MKAEFTCGAEPAQILITPENTEELEALLTWDKCAISAKMIECTTAEGQEPGLLIFRGV